jgi:hypothetical protein
MHTSHKEKLSEILKRMYRHCYQEFIPTAAGSDLDDKLTKSYGQCRLPGESDDNYRDRLTRPVTERYEIH